MKIKNVKLKIAQENLDALLISSVTNILYLTGYPGFADPNRREAFVLIAPKSQYVITSALYAEEIQKTSPEFTLVEISREKSFSQAIQSVIKKENLKKIGFEPHKLYVAEYLQLKKELPLVTTDYIVESARQKKSDGEIAAIQKACEIGDNAFLFILTKIKEGITEKELAFELEFFIKKQGATLSFDSIVAFGAHASMPHYQTGNSKLKKNSFVLLDFGVKIDNYCSDMTRTIFFGKPTNEQKKMYDAVYQGQQKAIRQCNNLTMKQSAKKVKVSEVDKAARTYIERQGYPSIPHSLGHGIGIDVHELPIISPNSKSELSEGMVFSIEPGIYIPNFGGVRIEDLFALEKNKLRQLTHSPSKKLIELQ